MSEVIQRKLTQTCNDIKNNHNEIEESMCGEEYNCNSYTNSYDAMVIERYISQIEEMKKENDLLERTNNELQEQIELTSSKILNETLIMQDIKNILGMSNQYEIKRTLQALIDETNTRCNNEQIIKDEFIMKLKQLYIELVGNADNSSNNTITYSNLEMLVHKVIDTVNDLMKQRNTNETTINNYSNHNSMRVLYRNFCKKIMTQNNISNINELEPFILSIVNNRELNIS